MKVLDCENFESTLKSVSILFNTSDDKVLNYLDKLDMESYYEKHGHKIYCHVDELIMRFFQKKFGKNHQPDIVYFFHLTRTNKGNKFEEGILPLAIVINKVWDLLYKIFEGTIHYSRLNEMHQSGINDSHYGLKLRGSMHWGPWAMLVKESAFRSKEMWNHDYLGLPEIIEDICNGYQSIYKEKIHDIVRKNLVPCIIKFQYTNINSDRWLMPAIYYLYCKIKNKPMSMHSNTCFSANNKIIPKSDIVNIEFLSVY